MATLTVPPPSQLTQALSGRFNSHVHVEYEWRLLHEDLDESDDDVDEKLQVCAMLPQQNDSLSFRQSGGGALACCYVCSLLWVGSGLTFPTSIPASYLQPIVMGERNSYMIIGGCCVCGCGQARELGEDPACGGAIIQVL